MDLDDKADGGLRPGAIAGGAILLVLGSTLLLDRTSLFHAAAGQLIGPFMLITIGALTLVEKGGVYCGYRPRRSDGTRPRLRRGGSISGLWLMGLGLWMLVSQLHLWGLDYHNSWPLLVILSGLMMLVRGVR